jgi:acyl-CoA synthetase (AMP-forming)/AMP-acid ligase II
MIVNESGNNVTSLEGGEFLVQGSNVFPGYWNAPEATAKSLKSGWYHTGDIMRRASGEELWCVSRKKDIIVVGGANVQPLEVEEALVASHSPRNALSKVDRIALKTLAARATPQTREKVLDVSPR